MVEEVDGDLMGDGVNIAARLEGICEPGGVCLSGAAYEQVRDRITETFADHGEKALKNVARPVRVYSLTRSRSAMAGKAGGAERASRLALPDKAAIAVLPFQNMSGDPEQEHFSDGISEYIITALSKLRWFFVIARNSSFTYKGRSVHMKQVAEELGVGYVLEGSVRKGGGRVRITAQLNDTATGSHIWGERYDRDLADVFAVQELVMRALSHLWRVTRQDNLVAEALLDKAVTLDPNYGQALRVRAFNRVLGGHLGWRDMASVAPDAERDAMEALRADGEVSWAHLALGCVHLLARRFDDALAEREQALRLNPNFSLGQGYGLTLAYCGRWEEGVAAADRALRLSPRDPLTAIYFGVASYAEYVGRKLRGGDKARAPGRAPAARFRWRPPRAGRLCRDVRPEGGRRGRVARASPRSAQYLIGVDRSRDAD